MVLLYTAIISLGLGFLNLVIVNLMPRMSARVGFYFCILLLVGVGVLLLVLYDRYIMGYCRFWREVELLKVLVAVVCFFIAVFVVVMICMFSN